MRKIKYVTIVTIFFVFITIMSEVKVYNSDFFINNGDCNMYYAFDLEMHDENRNQKFLSMFQKQAEKRGLGVYVVYQKIENYNQKSYTVYANKKAKNILKDRLKIYHEPVRINSFFMGNTKVEFRDLKELPLKNMYCIQFFGDIKKAREIRAEMVSIFDSSAVYPGQDLKDIYFTEKGIIGVAFILILISSGYYAAIAKKEYTVRFILGESVKSRIIKKLLFDGIVLLLLQGIILLEYRWYFGEQINVRYYAVLILMFILGSSVPELLFMKMDIRKEIRKNGIFSRLRMFSYILKGMACVLIIFLLSSNLFFIVQGVNVVNQEEHWKKLKDYKSIYIPVSDVDESVLKKEFSYLGDDYDYKKYKNSLIRTLEIKTGLEFYAENYKSAFIFGAQNIEGEPTAYILNRNAFDLVLKNEPEIKKMAEGKKVAVLYPKGKKEFVQTDVKNLDENDVMQYNQHIKLFNYDRNSRMISENAYLKNPIIYLIDSVPDESVKYNIEKIKDENEIHLSSNEPYYSIDRILSVSSESIYFNLNMKKKDYQSFLNQRKQYVDKFHIEENDIYELYRGEKEIYINILYINSVMSLLLLLLDLFLQQMILKMEFQMNSKEISIKKILGYNKRERYKSIYLTSIIASVLSFIAILIILILFKEKYVYYAATGFAFVMMIEQLMLQRNIHKYERENIPSILKGARV